MINKFYKRIHNKYSKFFNFFFFLRYIISIFFVALCLFLLIPKFINYEKKLNVLSQSLDNFYNLELKGFDSIKYDVFPLPNLSIKNANLNIKNEAISLKTKNLRIFLNLKNIYNYQNFKARKVFMKENKLVLNIDNTKDIIIFFNKLKNRIDIQDLDIIFKKNNNSIFEINNIAFSNYGFKKNKISGIIFKKKFKLKSDEKNKKISFKILNSGVKAKLDFEKIDAGFASGFSKIIVLKNYLKLNFVIQNNRLEIMKANFRNNDISLSLNSLITFNPFFEIISSIEINKFNRKLFDKVNLKEILKNREVLKKFNSQIEINLNKKIKVKNITQAFKSKIELEHGRLTFLSNIDILGGKIECRGDSFLLEEFPRLNFKCIIDIKDEEKILKKFSIRKKINVDLRDLNITGSINILNNKINFENISAGKTYNAKKEDLNYFKKSVEEILLNESLLGVFKTAKIKNFLIEII